jgi:hypothetical protein
MPPIYDIWGLKVLGVLNMGILYIIQSHPRPGTTGSDPGIFFTEACFSPGFSRRNFAENVPHDLKMMKKDASRNSTQSVIKISS